ncbi:MAG: ADP-ribosylglycohydrolase family protein [Spirochaetes bacterium]|nr:ADP-ribosylglycohydrolase family protein [Spirochaetota bacterium]
MDTTARNAILAAIVGDALGSTLDGLGKGHIRAAFRVIDGYIDPEPALKGKMERWRKPGLYSSISQFMLIRAMACARRWPGRDEFVRLCAAATGPAGSGGIFRNPDAVERNFIARVSAGTSLQGALPSPCARILPAMAPACFRTASPSGLMADVIPVVRLFTHDHSTMALCLFFPTLLNALISGNASTAVLVRESAAAARALADDVESNSGALFEMGVTPDTLAGELAGIAGLLTEMEGAGSLEDAEWMICARVNRVRTTPVTRATVGLPTALLPYAIAICAFHLDSASLLFRAVSEGGSTAPLTALTGAIGACCGETVVPDALLMNLVNRRKILSLLDSLFGNGGAPDADDFFQSERSLTSKEQEELRARLKHSRKKSKPRPSTRADRERELSRHAVESWTKLDKARWKKERKQMDGK